MPSILVDRPGNAPLTADDRITFHIIDSLEEVAFAGC